MISGTITDAAAAPSRARPPRRSGTRWPTPARSASGSTARSVPAALRPYVQELSRVAPVFVSTHPNAGLPNEFGQYDETPGVDGGGAARVRRARAGEPGGRLLRHHAGPHPGHSPKRCAACRRARPRCPAAPPPPERPRAAHDRPRQHLRERGRADQRHRLPQVRQADPGRRVRRRASRSPASRWRAAPRCSTSTWTRGCSTPQAGDDDLPPAHRLGARHQPGAGGDRLVQVVGHRGGPQVRPGQGRRQLDQPQGGRGGVRPPGHAGAPLRRGGDRDGVRRAGPGRHRRAEGRDLPARLPDPHRAGRASRPRTSSSTRTSSPSPPGSRSTTTTPWPTSRRPGGSRPSCRTCW